MRVYPNLRELAAAFDYFVLDVWGVLHDGETPYPGAITGLAALKRSGKKALLLSNTPSTAEILREELSAFGFLQETCEEILTSGQITREMIRRREDQGQSYYYIGPSKRFGLLAGLGYRSTTRLEEAGFLMVTGLNDERPEVADYQELLHQADQLGLPMYCANPDLAISRQDGSIIPCAGRLARDYEDLGGTVHSYGKPAPIMYREALARLGCYTPGQAAAVGDSLATDVKGAQAAGLYTVLLAGGLVAEQVGSTDPQDIADFGSKNGLYPDAVLQNFAWPAD
jgi:HAD superfamily hydrolase (TIGR01459 family)